VAENQTVPSDQSVEAFLNAVPDAQKRADSFALLALMQRVTGAQPVMWGPAIVGFGSYHYRYESGREGDAPKIAFSPRKQNLALYSLGLANAPDLAERLGKYKTGKGCLYINRLADIDLAVLEELVRRAAAG
jgi:hypothetical protein